MNVNMVGLYDRGPSRAMEFAAGEDSLAVAQAFDASHPDEAH